MLILKEKLSFVVAEILEAYDGDIAPLVFVASNFYPNPKNLSWQFRNAIASLPKIESNELYPYYKMLEKYGCFKVLSYTQEYFAENKEHLRTYMSEDEYENRNTILLDLIKDLAEPTVGFPALFRPKLEA